MKDLIIIGAGPIGLSCGIEAKKNNLEYLIIDKGMLVNSIFNYPTNTTFFSTSDKLEIGDIPFISHNVKPTRTEALEYYRRVSNSWELNLSLYNEVLKIKNENDYFSITTQNGKFESRNIVICTGFYDIPYLLNIAPSFSAIPRILAPAVNNDLAEFNPTLPNPCIIIS